MELYLRYRWREIAAAADTRPYWLDDVAALRQPRGGGLRGALGQALIRLGRAITAERAHVGPVTSPSAQ